MDQPWNEGRVIELKHWGGRLYSLRVEAEIASFEAGQFIKIGLPINGEILGRPYSLVNAPNEKPLEVYFIAIEGKPLTPQLVALKAGDIIYVAPHTAGSLVLSEIPSSKHLWLMATGTGIGPFLSILKTNAPWERFEKVVLVQAVRTTADLNYQCTVREITEQHPSQFIFVPFVSREDTDFAIRGRVPQAISDGRLEAQAGMKLSAADSQVMLCGNPQMIRETTEALLARRLRKHHRSDPGHIWVEPMIQDPSKHVKYEIHKTTD